MNLPYLIRKLTRPKIIENHGIKLHVDRDALTPGICKALYKNVYEREETELALQVLNETDRVLEIGAGIGSVSLLCAKICGEKSVLSYEANPAMVQMIERNFELNGFTANLRSKAVTVDEDEVTFYFSKNILSSSLIDRGFGGETRVAADRISDVIKGFEANVIVMDTEGAEVDLLMKAPLKNIDKILLETHPHVVGHDKISGLVSHLHGEGLHLNTDKCASDVLYFARS